MPEPSVHDQPATSEISHPSWRWHLTGTAARWLMGCAVVFFLAHQAGHITDPPNGHHEWREALTASVSLCYYQESMSFFEPRVHYRGATPGISGMEMPIFNYLIALLYIAFGPAHIWARLVVLCAASGALFLLYKLLRLWFGLSRAACGIFCLSMSPLFLFYGSRMVPDAYVLLPFMATVWFFGLWFTSGKAKYWWMSAMCLIIAASIKPPCLTVYLPFAYLTFLKHQQWGKTLRQLAAYIALTLLPAAGWVEFARSLTTKYHTSAFSLGLRFSEVWAAIQSGWFFKMNVVERPWELWVGWVLVPAFIFGLYRAYKSVEGRFIMLWALGCFIGLGIIAQHSAMHDYDGTLIVLPFAAITGLGLFDLLNMHKRWRILALLLMLAAPVSAVERIHHRYAKPPFDQIRAEAATTIKPNELVIAEDWSPIIRLYQLNRFGWPMRPSMSEDEIKQAVHDGAAWFVLEQPLSKQQWNLTPYIADTTPIHIGPLLAFRIKESQ